MCRNYICKKILIVIFLTSTFLLTACSEELVKDKKINIAFRMDDPSSLSSTETELKVLDAFSKNEASVTYGIVPFACRNGNDPSAQDLHAFGVEKGNIFKKWIEKGTLDIALHGYSHQTRDAVNKSEFKGANYDSQLEKLLKGKKLLETLMDVPVTTFIPPWNQYDTNTLNALEEAEFSTISAAISIKDSPITTLNFLPYTVEPLYIHDAIKEARASLDVQPLIVVLFHVYDFKEVNKEYGYMTFKEFEDQLRWLKSQKDIQLMSISQASKMIKNLDVNRLKSSYEYKNFAKYLPSSLVGSKFTYQESPNLMQLFFKIVIFYLLIIVLIGVISYKLSCFGLLKFPRIIKVLTFGSILISVIILLYAAHDQVSHFKEMIIVIVSMSISLGLWKCYYRR